MVRWSVAQFRDSLYFYAAFAEYPPSINALRDLKDGWTLQDGIEFCRYLNQREQIGTVIDARVRNGALEATVKLNDEGWRLFGIVRRLRGELSLFVDGWRASKSSK